MTLVLDIEDQNNGQPEKVAIIRTTDRMSFRSCRRRWSWQSGLRQGLETKSYPLPFWFGTGIHYALEDFHGYRKFDRVSDAWLAYVRAQDPELLSLHTEEEIAEHVVMGAGMMDYYQDCWLRNRAPLETLWIDGKPMVECNILADITDDLGFDVKKYYGWDKVVYSATIDRVIIDELGDIWAVDYKTTKSLKTTHLANDPQASAYSWIAHRHFGTAIKGLIYWQFVKTLPKINFTAKTGMPSTNKTPQNRQGYWMVRDWLMEKYGLEELIPYEQRAWLGHLAVTESIEADRFIRRDRIYRSEVQHGIEFERLRHELVDMLNPQISCYPNMNFTCQWCGMFEPCQVLESGSAHWEEVLETMTQPSTEKSREWRNRIHAT